MKFGPKINIGELHKHLPMSPFKIQLRMLILKLSMALSAMALLAQMSYILLQLPTPITSMGAILFLLNIGWIMANWRYSELLDVEGDKIVPVLLYGDLASASNPSSLYCRVGTFASRDESLTNFHNRIEIDSQSERGTTPIGQEAAVITVGPGYSFLAMSDHLPLRAKQFERVGLEFGTDSAGNWDFGTVVYAEAGGHRESFSMDRLLEFAKQYRKTRPCMPSSIWDVMSTREREQELSNELVHTLTVAIGEGIALGHENTEGGVEHGPARKLAAASLIRVASKSLVPLEQAAKLLPGKTGRKLLNERLVSEMLQGRIPPEVEEAIEEEYVKRKLKAADYTS